MNAVSRLAIMFSSTARYLTLLIALPLLACLAGCPPSGNGGEIEVRVKDEGGGEPQRSRTPEELLVLAKSEGQINWYTSMSQDEATRFLTVFNKKYPDLTVKLVRGGTFGLADRIETEFRQGRVNADVLHVLDPAIFLSLRKEDNLAIYDAPQAREIPAEYKQEGYWATARLVTLGMAYNASRLSPSKAPKNWSDLMNPRWSGKIGMKDATSAGAAYAHYYFLRDRYGAHYWEQMAALKVRIYKTEDELLNALRSGEIEIASGVALGRSKQRDGVGTIWPKDGVPVVLGPVAVLSRSPHPNAARVFVNFMLSKEGQEALRDYMGAYSARTDVAPPAEFPPLEELRLLRPPSGRWEEYLEDQDDLRAEYRSLFGPDEGE